MGASRQQQSGRKRLVLFLQFKTPSACLKKKCLSNAQALQLENNCPANRLAGMMPWNAILLVSLLFSFRLSLAFVGGRTLAL